MNSLTINFQLTFSQLQVKELYHQLSQMIKNGGFPINVYRKLFDSCVCSVSDYGGEIWGFKAYESNRQLQLKACRAYLGAPKQTAIPGLLSEMNWCEPRSRTQVQMVRYFHRLLKIEDQRLLKKIIFGIDN